MIFSIFALLSGLALFACQDKNPAVQADRTTEPAPQATQSSSPIPRFDAGRAFRYLTAQTDFGPRNPGSPGHRNCLDYIQSELRASGARVNTQPFTIAGYDKEVLRLTNVFASFNPQSATRILLLSHWDTRPRADNDPDPKKKNQKILGANDGASGVAVLLEIARQLKSAPPPVGVDLLFVDGEDYGKEGDERFYLLGARYFAKNIPAGYHPAFGILLDMIGDKDLDIPKDRYSVDYAPDIVDLVWSTAASLHISQFNAALAHGWTTDDHLPLNEAGIKTIDLIDFAYPDESNRYWHSTQDTPDKCSPESLDAVGTVLLNLIFTYQ